VIELINYFLLDYCCLYFLSRNLQIKYVTMPAATEEKKKIVSPQEITSFLLVGDWQRRDYITIQGKDVSILRDKM
ncbi:hypothetical protein DW208_11465, partial [Erysipelotrichaceae bacterium AM17-60]